MIMRPDEKAVESEIERDQRFRSNVSKGIGTAAGLIGGASVSGAASKVLPWLSSYIPPDLAMKGLSKVSPQIANFIKRGQSMGLNIEEGLQYVKDEISSKKESPKQDRNIIQQYSPELHEFISQQVSGGRTPIETAAIAQHDKRFSDIIKKLTKDHKTDWSKIVDSVYGGGQYGSSVNPDSEQQQQQQQQQPQVQGQVGAGSQALMDILSKINQKLGQ